jgi:hypothetical protein
MISTMPGQEVQPPPGTVEIVQDRLETAMQATAALTTLAR